MRLKHSVEWRQVCCSITYSILSLQHVDIVESIGTKGLRQVDIDRLAKYLKRTKLCLAHGLHSSTMSASLFWHYHPKSSKWHLYGSVETPDSHAGTGSPHTSRTAGNPALSYLATVPPPPPATPFTKTANINGTGTIDTIEDNTDNTRINDKHERLTVREFSSVACPVGTSLRRINDAAGARNNAPGDSNSWHPHGALYS